MSTPRISAQHGGADPGHLSDITVTPREEDSEAWKAGSGPGSKHSSLSSHDTSLVQQSLRSDNQQQASLQHSEKSTQKLPDLNALIPRMQNILNEQQLSRTMYLLYCA